MIKKPSRKVLREKRHWRMRNKLSGTASCPRLAVFRSNKHIYAQVIDDVQGVTIAAASTMEKEISNELKTTSDINAATAVGTAVAERAKAKGIEEIVFDRGGYVYHGKVAALADAAREAGLKF